MQKVIIDTNVLVSALLQRSYPYHIINALFFERKITACISVEVFDEYYEVLSRKKFAKYPDFISNAQAILVDIEKRATKFRPKSKINIISDQDDNKFLELAEESNADFLITGNTKDFTMEKYKTTKIVTPKEYWEKFFNQ